MRLVQSSFRRGAYIQLAQHGIGDVVRRCRLRQRHKDRAVGELPQGGVGHLQRQARLANARRADLRDQPRRLQPVHQRRHLFLPTQQRQQQRGRRVGWRGDRFLHQLEARLV